MRGRNRSTQRCRDIESQLNKGTPIQRCSICRGTPAGVVVDWDFIPVPSFGNPSKSDVKIATIGLNPASNEPRLPKLKDYRKHSRENLTEEDLNNCASRRERYFDCSEESWHDYFQKFESLLGRVNHLLSYARNAVHVDLVACVTKVRIGLVGNLQWESLVRNCQPHFLKTVRQLPSGTILLLDGAAVCDNVLSLGQPIYDIGPEMILKDPQIVGMRGTIVIETRKFRFLGWRGLSVCKMNVLQRIDLAIWLRSSL
jgi:hypothetical protein